MKKIVKTLTVIILTVLISATLCFGDANTTFSYPTAKLDVSDISFYQPSSDITPYPVARSKKVKNIIFCIGDGMGLSQVEASRLKAAGSAGVLYMERMPFVGLNRTHSANALVTDSAAAVTALACGIKTNNGILGMAPDKTKYQTILEAAKNKGKRTGLVATCGITHATPAGFASHVKSRNNRAKIAEQMLANKVNVMLAGGWEYFLPKSHLGSKRKDERNLIEEAKSAGYEYIQTPQELSSAKSLYLLGLFQPGALTTNPPEPTLAELAEKAIEVLNCKKKGFFLMVEGSQIDWACHDNNIDNAVKQTLLFDQAVKVAIDFALKDKHTLVVVTADHETGGLTIPGGDLAGKKIDTKWSTGGHSAMDVPIYAFGPRAEIFSGVYDNTDIPKKFAKLFGIKKFPKQLK
ncbi:MAG: alkaline phosphatase [Planctomycetes bacterium]|nr:alkaline phosphatase [Planctomycetota bacterium]